MMKNGKLKCDSEYYIRSQNDPPESIHFGPLRQKTGSLENHSSQFFNLFSSLGCNNQCGGKMITMF